VRRRCVRWGPTPDNPRTLDGGVYVSVSLVLQHRQVETPVWSDDLELHADRLKHELGVAPSLDGVWHEDTFHLEGPQFGHAPRRRVRLPLDCVCPTRNGRS
jgi:hypothetical protein